MASRFGNRDRPNALFSAYDAQNARAPSNSSTQRSNANGYPSSSSNAFPPRTFDQQSRPTSNPAFSVYPGSSGLGADRADGGYGFNGEPSGSGQFRSATPNRRGQYSDAVLNELESQNDEQLEGMSAKVRMLKEITVAIGDEIRDSTKLAESMNTTFENTQLRLRGTMNRMLRMAEKTGVGWKVWALFFLAIIAIFVYVRLF